MGALPLPPCPRFTTTTNESEPDVAEDTPETGPARIPDRAERNAATSFRDHASGPPSKADAHQGRPQDLEQGGWKGESMNSTLASRAKGDSGKPDGRPAHASNTTMAQRAKAREAAEKKQQKSDDSEDKAVSSAATKARRSTKK